AGREEAEEHAVAEPSAREQPMERPERKRQELRLLQLEMRVMIDAVRQEREDDASENSRRRTSGQLAHQQRNAGARHDEAGQKDDVVDEYRPEADPAERRRGERRRQQRFGKGQRPPLGIKDVAVEEVR